MKRNLSLMEPSLTFKLRQSAPGDPHGPLRALCWKTYKQTSIANPLLGCSCMPQAIGTTSFVDYFMRQAIGTTRNINYFMPPGHRHYYFCRLFHAPKPSALLVCPLFHAPRPSALLFLSTISCPKPSALLLLSTIYALGAGKQISL